jgi:dihydroorotate dehydrogenase
LKKRTESAPRQRDVKQSSGLGRNRYNFTVNLSSPKPKNSLNSFQQKKEVNERLWRVKSQRRLDSSEARPEEMRLRSKKRVPEK